jgi:anti-sigma-K factor RskA
MSLPLGPDHDRWADATGSYVLGAMPDEEAAAFAMHLQGCAACRAEVEELEPAANALPASVPPVPAPASIGARLMAEVRREAQLLAAAGEGADRPAPDEAQRPAREARGRLGRWTTPVLVAAALLLGVVAGLAVSGVTGGGSTRTITAQATGAAQGARAHLTMGDGRAILTVSHLPQPPAGHVYQVWLKPQGGAAQATQSLFAPRSDGSASVAVPASAKHMEAVMVTAEPDGGSDAPTSAPVLTANVS